MPALFWAALGLYHLVAALQDGLTVRRAVRLGSVAALAVATKDASYAVFLFLPLTLLPAHYRRLTSSGVHDMWGCLKAPLVGLLVAAALYSVASGLVLFPQKVFRHLEFIRGGAPHHRYYFEYPATAVGYLGLARRSLGYLVDPLNSPLVLLGLAGIVVAWKTRAETITLLLPIPATLLAVLLPVRHVELRYVLVMDYVLVLFAACALAKALSSSSRPLRAFAAILFCASADWQVLRAADLTWLMWHESRLEAQHWFAERLKSPATVEYFGDGTSRGTARVAFLAHLPEGSRWAVADVGLPPGIRPPAAQYVVVQGPEDFEKHWYCPERTYRGLVDGSYGYTRVASLEPRSLFSHRSLRFNPNLNPRMEIFERTALSGPATKNSGEPR